MTLSLIARKDGTFAGDYLAALDGTAMPLYSPPATVQFSH